LDNPEHVAVGLEPEEYTSTSQWLMMMNTMREKGIHFAVITFDEEGDADCVKMRMVAIWEAQESMERVQVSGAIRPLSLRKGEGGGKPHQIQKGFYGTMQIRRR
jgi:hypothetical protein